MQGRLTVVNLPTSVIQGNPPLYEETSPCEALSVVSQPL